MSNEEKKDHIEKSAEDLMTDLGPDPKSDLGPASREDIKDLDAILRRTLLDIIKSGEASPGHLNVARAYLKDKGYTLPELAKRKRVNDDSAAFEEISEEELFH